MPSKISLTGYRLSHVACRNAPPPPIGVVLHEEVSLPIIHQDKTRQFRVRTHLAGRLIRLAGQLGSGARVSASFYRASAY